MLWGLGFGRLGSQATRGDVVDIVLSIPISRPRRRPYQTSARNAIGIRLGDALNKRERRVRFTRDTVYILLSRDREVLEDVLRLTCDKFEHDRHGSQRHDRNEAFESRRKDARVPVAYPAAWRSSVVNCSMRHSSRSRSLQADLMKAKVAYSSIIAVKVIP